MLNRGTRVVELPRGAPVVLVVASVLLCPLLVVRVLPAASRRLVCVVVGEVPGRPDAGPEATRDELPHAPRVTPELVAVSR